MSPVDPNYLAELGCLSVLTTCSFMLVYVFISHFHAHTSNLAFSSSSKGRLITGLDYRVLHLTTWVFCRILRHLKLAFCRLESDLCVNTSYENDIMQLTTSDPPAAIAIIWDSWTCSFWSSPSATLQSVKVCDRHKTGGIFSNYTLICITNSFTLCSQNGRHESGIGGTLAFVSSKTLVWRYKKLYVILCL